MTEGGDPAPASPHPTWSQHHPSPRPFSISPRVGAEAEQHRGGCPQGLVSQRVAPAQRGPRAQVCARSFFMYSSHRGKRFTSLILSRPPSRGGGERSLRPSAKELTLPSDKHQHTPAARQVSGAGALIFKFFLSHFTVFPHVFKDWAGQNFKLGKKEKSKCH